MVKQRFKDHGREQMLVFRRMIVAFAFIGLLSSLLAARLFYLQVVNHEVHVARSNNNRISLQALPPNRGLIYDTRGRLLAENLPNHRLSIIRERVTDLDATLAQVRTLVELSDDDVERFRRQLERSRRPFSPVPLKEGLSEEEIARLAANRYFLDGVTVEASLMRHYPYGRTFAHVLGYVGRINVDERRVLDEGLYSSTEYIGKAGIERVYESALLGVPGSQTVEINARGRILQVLDRTLPTPGADVQLFLDIELQQAAYKALDGRRGAAVVIDVKTGGILAMVSTPSFDPNSFVRGFSNTEFSLLNNSPDKPFLDRAARGQYAPASTIKPFLGIAGLEAGTTSWDATINDPGWFRLPNDDRLYYDWTWRTRRDGHGTRVGMVQAIEESSNTFFYDLAYRTQLEALHETLDNFGFGKVTAADVHNPASGLNPSRDWKRSRHGMPWFAGDTVNLGIGQGFLLTTPLQMSIATAVLARDGEWFTPRLIKDSSDPELLANLPEPPPDVILRDDSNWSRMTAAMRRVIHGPRGTARRLALGIDYDIAGKTGTAQVFSIENFEEFDSEQTSERLRDHAWFMGFAPANNPQLAVAVIVENGASGGGIAGPVARQIFDHYMNRPVEEVLAFEY